jgi:uncharacterized protein YcaQ
MARDGAVELSRVEARRLLLAAQGLSAPPSQPACKSDVLQAIRRIGALQIDTISVVNRSPYFVLWSRLGSYDPAWLDELLAEGALFEYWAHAACFLSIEDYPFYRGRMLERLVQYAPGWDTVRILEKHSALREAILDRIRAEGPLGSSDFESAERRALAGWWNWRDEKFVLEALFDTGELMIARRRNFQRVYDLRERIMPGWDDANLLPKEEVERTLTLRAVRALGVATAAWARDYFRISAAATSAALKTLAREGLLKPARIEGIQGVAYIHPDDIESAGQAASDVTRLLSPFDPIVWDRRRALELFGFDYRIECYTPAPQRRYGYFSLPVLRHESLIGRADAKAHRKEGIFEVRNLHLEPGIEASDELLADVAATLQACAVWHRTAAVTVARSDPPSIAAELNRLLAN